MMKILGSPNNSNLWTRGTELEDIRLSMSTRAGTSKYSGAFTLALSHLLNSSDTESDGYDTSSSSSSSSLASHSSSDTPLSDDSLPAENKIDVLPPPALETELSISELSTLVGAAQEDGNVDAVEEVRLLIQDAQRTPRHNRTAASAVPTSHLAHPNLAVSSPRRLAPTICFSPSACCTHRGPKHRGSLRGRVGMGYRPGNGRALACMAI